MVQRILYLLPVIFLIVVGTWILSLLQQRQRQTSGIIEGLTLTSDTSENQTTIVLTQFNDLSASNKTAVVSQLINLIEEHYECTQRDTSDSCHTEFDERVEQTFRNERDREFYDQLLEQRKTRDEPLDHWQIVYQLASMSL